MDPAIQRRFEWDESKIKSACIKIYETAQEFRNDMKGADCRRRFGTIECYEIPREDSTIVIMYVIFWRSTTVFNLSGKILKKT